MKKKLCLIFTILFLFTHILVAVAVSDKNGGKEGDAKDTALINSHNVRLLLCDENKVINIDIDDYTAGVLVGEMYQNAPEEALKAMAVAVRTYTLYMMNKNQNNSYDVSTDSGAFQAYVKRNSDNVEKYKIMDSVVEKTKGEVLLYDGEVILAMYHASSLNYTESCENVFVEYLPYLTSVFTPFEDTENAYFTSSVLSYDELNSVLTKNGFPSFSKENLFLKIETNDKGRCESLIFTNDTSGIYIQKNKIRAMFNLRSTTFDAKLTDEGLEFIVYGYGHGVGLSQNGAVILAERGETYEKILKKYYSDCEIYKTIYKS